MFTVKTWYNKTKWSYPTAAHDASHRHYAKLYKDGCKLTKLNLKLATKLKLFEKEKELLKQEITKAEASVNQLKIS